MGTIHLTYSSPTARLQLQSVSVSPEPSANSGSQSLVPRQRLIGSLAPKHLKSRHLYELNTRDI